jgi:hypothetical protein
MSTHQIFYDSVSNQVHDANGKVYEIKEYNRSKCVNYNNTRIALSKIPVKPFIKDFDSVISRYILEWHLTHPCPAIAYYIYLKTSNKRMSLQDYFKTIAKN